MQNTHPVSPMEGNEQEQELPTEGEGCNESSGSSSKASKAPTRSLPTEDSPSLSFISPARANGNESEIGNNLEISRRDNGSGRRRRGLREIWDGWNHRPSSREECDSQRSVEGSVEECSDATDDTEQETQACLDSVFGYDLETPKAWTKSDVPTVLGKSDQGTADTTNPPNNNVRTYARDEMELLEADIRNRTLFTRSYLSLNNEDGNGGTQVRLLLQKGTTIPLKRRLTGSQQYSPSSTGKFRKKSVEEENGFHPALQNHASRRCSSGRRSSGESFYDDSEHSDGYDVGNESMKGISAHDIDTYLIEGIFHLRFRSVPLEKAFMDSYSEKVVP